MRINHFGPGRPRRRPPHAPPTPPLPWEHVTSRDRGRMWWLGIEAKVAPRSHAPGGDGNAGQATAPEAGGEATGAAAGHGGLDCLRGPGMWWFGFEAQVVPGAPCGCLLLPQRHELLLRGRCALAHLPCQDRARGLGSAVVCSKRPVVAYEKSPTRSHTSSFGMSVIRSFNLALSEADGISMKTFV